ncbi:O-antigen ligase family protein [Bacteroidota bacterium]
MLIKKEALIEILLINSFIFALFISMISNYSRYSFVLKFISVLILYFFIYTDIRTRKIQIDTSSLKRLFLYILVPIFLAALSLFYSLNPAFGVLKLFNILIAVMPIVTAFHYLFATRNESRTKLAVYSLFVLGFVSTLLVIILSPFDYTTLYSFSPLRWSHVTYGRLMSIIFLSSLYVLIEKRGYFDSSLISLLAGLFFAGIFLSGLRAALIGTALIGITSLIIGLIHNKITLKDISVFAFTVLILLLTLNYFNAGAKTVDRYSLTIGTDNDELILDSSWQTRTNAWLIAMEMIKERPIAGSGLGGFNRYYITSLPQGLRYPHNIFLEVGVELGIAGLIGLLFLLWQIFRSAKRVSVYWLVLLGYSLWLAFFAKDISTNTLLWLGLVFINGKRKQLADGNEQRILMNE